jgi:anti-sigma factor RsiW
MPFLACHWNRSRLLALADGALEGRWRARAARHTAACARCRDEVERLRGLREAVKEAAPPAVEPDWSAFWPRVQARLRMEPARPIREPWWRPFWKPVWGHPRVAMASVAATAVLLGVSLWPGREGEVPLAEAGSVVVQDVATGDPDGSVMVYTDPDRGPDRGVTVIWVFASNASR